jgi:hypothetical protein
MTNAAPYIAPKRQADILPVSLTMVEQYWEMFVNNPEIFNLQTEKPGENGKHYYYRPKHADLTRLAWQTAWKQRPVTSSKNYYGSPSHREAAGTIYERLIEERGLPEYRGLTKEDVGRHLAGHQTINCFSTNPETQKCKWIAIDADYDASRVFKDLARLKYDLSEVGVQALFEHSRRGGHLWILAADPLPAALCRTFVYNLALRLEVPIKGHMSEVEGIEVFPRQNRLEKGYYGNAIRGPLGIHRATTKRYWFEGANGTLEDQFRMLSKAKRLTLNQLENLTYGMTPIEENPPETSRPIVPVSSSYSGRRPFNIREHVTIRRKDRRNVWAQCPSCARQGSDRSRDNLAINKDDSRLYKCWAGCSKDDIRAACGYGPSLGQEYLSRGVS